MQREFLLKEIARERGALERHDFLFQSIRFVHQFNPFLGPLGRFGHLKCGGRQQYCSDFVYDRLCPF